MSVIFHVGGSKLAPFDIKKNNNYENLIKGDYIKIKGAKYVVTDKCYNLDIDCIEYTIRAL